MAHSREKGGEVAPRGLRSSRTLQGERVRWQEDEAQLRWQAPRIRRGCCPRECGERGGNRRRRRKADQGNGGRGGNRRSRREIAVDKRRKEKEAVDRVARHQAGH